MSPIFLQEEPIHFRHQPHSVEEVYRIPPLEPVKKTAPFSGSFSGSFLRFQSEPAFVVVDIKPHEMVLEI